MMRNRLLSLSSLLLLVLIQSCGNSSSVKDEEAKVNTDSINNALMAEVKGEPKVKEAVLTDAKVLYVAVEDDGTPRDGYASYICELVKEHKVHVGIVKVVEVGTTKSPDADNAYGKLLGESICE